MAEGKLLKRDLYCGRVNEEYLDRNITVYGWVNKKGSWEG